MLVWKELIRPGTYWYVDEKTGKPARLDATPEMIRYWHEQGKSMLDAGLSIPVPLEHQPDHKPLTAGEKAARQLLNNTGWVNKYDLRHGDRLYTLLNIENEEAARKLPSTIKYTSPYFSSFMDGTGKQWKGVVTHVALTSRPRIHQQEPFGTAEAALSLARPIGVLPEGYSLSLAGLLVRDSARNVLVPNRPMAFSVLTGAKLAEDFPPEKPAEKKTPTGEKKPEEAAETVVEEIEQDEDMDLVDIACDLVSAIWGIDLPEMTNEDNLAQNLLKSLTDYLRTKDLPGKGTGNDPMANPDTMNKPPATATGAAPIVAETPPVFMSLEQIKSIADPTTRRLAEQLYVQQQKTASYEARALAAARQARDQRLKKLCDRMPHAAREQLLNRAQATAAALSIGSDGNVVDPLADTLDLMEMSLRDLPALLVANGAALSLEDHPVDSMGGPMSEERRRQVVEEYTGKKAG